MQAVSISILGILKSLQNYWHRVTYLTSFQNQGYRHRVTYITSLTLTEGNMYHKLQKTFMKFLRSYPKLLSKFIAISFQENVSKGITHPVFYDDLVNEFRRLKGEANHISSSSKKVKRLQRRQYDQTIIERTIGLVLDPITAAHRSLLERCTLKKRKRSDSVLWQKPIHRLKNPKSNTKMPQKLRLHNDWGPT